MRLKLIETMQTPPKDRESTFFYPESMLNKGLAKACEIESALFETYNKEEERKNKFRNLIYALAMKYTEIKV